MKFLIDAHLSVRIKDFLIYKGFDSLHTLDLKDSNATTDEDINDFCEKNDFVLMTKDKDFLSSYLFQKKPKQLILVRAGNMSNSVLLNLISNHLNLIIDNLMKYNLIEITTSEIIVHE
jgi:predicted nuclease of predicted toxin-antitoxin system